MNIILFKDLAEKVQTQLYEPTSLIHVLFIITPHLGISLNTMVSDNDTMFFEHPLKNLVATCLILRVVFH